MRNQGQKACAFAIAATSLAIGVWGGCAPSSGPIVNDILDVILRQQQGALPTETAVVDIINSTDATVEMDLLIDNVKITISCNVDEGPCRYVPSTCPKSIKAVEERRFNSENAVTLQRFYDDQPGFTFDRTDFTCQSVIVFTFSPDNTVAQVL